MDSELAWKWPPGWGHVGAFALEALDPATTRFTWQERLAFPWYLGGPLTALLAAPVLAAIWKRNLRRLKSLLER